MIIVTNQMFENQFLTGLQQNLESELTDTQEISTGYKVNQPSDDPAALVQIVGYKTQLSDITQYQNAITSAKAPLQSLDSTLSSLNNTLQRANELAISGVSGPDADALSDDADELQQLLTTAVSIANTNVNGQYIFAGDNSNVNPIDPNTGELMSDNNAMTQSIGVDVNVTTNVKAGSLFSFARVNGEADSTTAILPTYNWTNNGANTIPDADPVSALETSAPTAGAFNSSNDIFTTNGGALNVTVGNSTTPSSGAFVINSSNNAISLDGTTYYIANGIYTGAGLANALENKLSLNASGSPVIGAPIIDVSYDTSGHKFTISDAGAGDSIDLTAAGTSTIGSIMGFNAAAAPEQLSTAITSDNAVGDVNLAAGSTLQNVRDAFNTASAGVKAQVVNVGTTATPDFRIVVASDPAGSSANIDISPLSTALTTTGSTDPSGAGVNMLSYNDAGTDNNMTLGTNITNYNYITQASANDSIVIDDGTNGGVANNQIVVKVGGTQETATIARGTYTPGQLATAIANALDAAATAAGKADTYNVAYDPNADKFAIMNKAGNPDTLDLLWSNSSSTAQTLLGYGDADDTIAAGSSDVSNNSVLANYYSFNNNYLNDKYILRALNFEQQSLQNNDSGRVQQAIQYTSDLSVAVSQTQATVGATEDEVNTESSQQANSQTDMETFLSDTQDTDLAAVTSDLSLRQTALEALRTITSDVLNQSLFDFIKSS